MRQRPSELPRKTSDRALDFTIITGTYNRPLTPTRHHACRNCRRSGGSNVLLVLCAANPRLDRADHTDSYIDAVANNFWGKDDAGVVPLLDRMVNSKQTCDELKSFYGGEDTCCQDDGLVVQYRQNTDFRYLQHELRSKMNMPES